VHSIGPVRICAEGQPPWSLRHCSEPSVAIFPGHFSTVQLLSSSWRGAGNVTADTALPYRACQCGAAGRACRLATTSGAIIADRVDVQTHLFRFCFGFLGNSLGAGTGASRALGHGLDPAQQIAAKPVSSRSRFSNSLTRNLRPVCCTRHSRHLAASPRYGVIGCACSSSVGSAGKCLARWPLVTFLG
jgi:hypothetical protein